MYIMCMCMVDPSHLLYLWFITCTDMWIYKDIYWLVVFNHLELNLENMKVNGWRIIPYIYIMENEKCLKPATSIYIYVYGSIPINTIFRGMNIHLNPAII